MTTDAIWGGLPIQLKFRNGSVLEEWSGLQSPEKLKTLNSRSPQSHAVNAILKKRQGWEEEKTFRTRHSVINLRIEAELLIFISQTGMNLAQAHKLKMGKFFYQSYGKGYQVKRVFKNRRQGEVEFSIYGHYRSLFENYLRWRNSLFATADNDLLFPLITSRGRSTDIAPTFNGIKRKCSQLSISFVTPRQLRLTRTNWLMRQTRNVALVSQMNQHEPRTLLDSYERPHHQVALTEITRFFNQSEQALSSPAPGACGRKKNEAVDLPHENLPVPDCLSAAGCLFCSHHRDIDSEDHAWSLASYRYLKSLELSKYKPLRTEAGQHPAKTVIEILSHKLLSFAQSSPVRTQWVTEANARIVEGNYHPKWDGFIQLIEIQYGN
ncbi:hypothetical protein [Herbaspirillum rubrisubalbicans]|uniref:hypothetical protein n=1 Tax=Herbaspirillum rubrisubalbicans TaxID=80842 RepID=UPI0011BE48B9|nr:hypothetical protein [Herbaspirillum rubrisubalbicans]